MCPEMQSSGQQKIRSDLRRAEIEYANREEPILYLRQLVKTQACVPGESFQRSRGKDQFS